MPAPGLSQAAPGWPASLELAFARRGRRTVLTHIRHKGPLLIQRVQYPEGDDGPAHVHLLHPPGGVVGGDTLDLDVEVGAGAQVLLTTPSANRWYRSDGRLARINQHLRIADGGVCEWLPLESIAFAGCRIDACTRIELSGSARLLAWEALLLGRPAAGETFTHGQVDARLELLLDGRPCVRDCGRWQGGGTALTAAWGLHGQPAQAILLAHPAPGGGIDALRTHCPGIAVTELGQTLLWRGRGGEARRLLAEAMTLRQILRPLLLDRPACAARVWNT